jgi:hypothetical protein
LKRLLRPLELAGRDDKAQDIDTDDEDVDQDEGVRKFE